MAAIVLGIVVLIIGLILVLDEIVEAQRAQAARRATCAQEDAYEIDGELFTAEEFARLMELHTAYQHTRTGGDAA